MAEIALAPYPEKPIFILDDEDSFRSAIARELRTAGIGNVMGSADPEEARSRVASGDLSLLLLDLHMPRASGAELLAEFQGLAPQVPVIIITGDSDTDTIVRCMKVGALDYLVKPIDETRLLASIWNGLSIVELKEEMNAFTERVLGGLAKPELFRRIATSDERMIALFKYIEAVAPSRQPVLITGETGTGKELFARAVHEASGREGTFVAVNVGGLDDTVFTDTLFGHLKGAYTGAEGARPGLVHEARGGTLFLDEVGELEDRSQIKLLRLLQESEYYSLGSDAPRRSEARIVSATTRDLREAAASGAFRSDLFYRLQTHHLALPPLRDRRGDIPLLAERFLEASTEDLGMTDPPELSLEAWEALRGYDFPGNVRELESLIHDAVAGSTGKRIDAAALLGRLPGSTRGGAAPEAPGYGGATLRLVGERFPSLREAEAELLRMALDRSEGNISLAASMLGVSRQTIYKWLSERNGG
jgi:two-component system, NtrC family, nitrogen regulation response regulator GlnG